MIKSLRKRHRQVWILGAILLPAGIILAWLVIPNEQPVVKLLQDQSTTLLPVIINTKKTDTYIISTRSNKENTQWQLEWTNKRSLMEPSAVIYTIADSTQVTTSLPKDAVLIGRIEARGNYVFPLANGDKQLHFILYDFIHQKIIEDIQLK